MLLALKWNSGSPLLRLIRANSKFEKGKEEQRKTHYQYWSDAMAGRLWLKEDDYQIASLGVLCVNLMVTKDALVKSITKLHDENKGTKSFRRTLTFMAILKPHVAPVRHFTIKSNGGDVE